ncbi:MAG: MFS transporter, partial [Gemmatimonadaceae bacterium]
ATAVYRGQVRDAMPAGVPTDALEAARATLGGAVAVAGQLPGHVGDALFRAARDAFVSSLRVSAAISAAIVVALAIAVVIVLRRRQPGADPGGSELVPDRRSVAA